MRDYIIFISVFTFILVSSCNEKSKEISTSEASEIKVRHQKDTIGFAQYGWQMDSVMARISSEDKQPNSRVYKAAICPHDDYAYAGGLYNKTLSGIKAKTIVLIGVAHRAANFKLENKVVFGTHSHWDSPYGGVKISALRNQLLQKLKKETFIVHDSMMQIEHSLEAIVPFLQKNNRAIEIIPMLVPHMTFHNMEILSEDISKAMSELMKMNQLVYGDDFAVVISNDAVHYGSEEWGGKDLAPYGTDGAGNEQARQKDLLIIRNCLEGELQPGKIKSFNQYTVNSDDYRKYAWVWCGRYSVPFGLLVSNKLNQRVNNTNLTGYLIDWRSSLHNPHIEVTDIGMGHTATASSKHWVAYVGMGYQ